MTGRHVEPSRPAKLLAAYKRHIGVPVDKPLPRYIIASWVILGIWVAAATAVVCVVVT